MKVKFSIVIVLVYTYHWLLSDHSTKTVLSGFQFDIFFFPFKVLLWQTGYVPLLKNFIVVILFVLI